jgi:HlyD family secretion protein
MSTEKPTLEGLRIERRAPARRDRPRWILPAVLAAAVLIGGAIWWLNQPKAIPVQTAIARTQTSASGSPSTTLLNASGYVTARRAATVSSKITGKVVQVSIEEGMKVEEGQVLARLDASNVEASLRLAEAQLQAARSALEETRPNLAFAQRELKRFTDLAATKIVSDSDLRRSEMEARGLEAKLARQTAEIAIRERELDQWQQQIDDTIIRAPFGGVVTSKNAQPGEMISPMSVGGFTRTGICTIVDMSSLEIEVDVNESFINRVRRDQKVEAVLDAYPEWRIPAHVITTVPSADRQKATVRVRIGFEQLDPRILPDMGVKVSFLRDEEPAQAATPVARVSVAKTAIRTLDGKTVVFVLRDDRVERRAVRAGLEQGNEVEVLSGLSAGERVVIEGPPTLKDGDRVTIK